MIVLQMYYYYRGSINSILTLKQQPNGDIDLITSYGEVAATVHDAYELVHILEDLDSGILA